MIEQEPEEGQKCLSKEQVVLDFKQEQNIWITIRIRKDNEKKAKKDSVTLVLKDLIICEYKYKVTPHFILYPEFFDGQYISLSHMSYGEVINRSREWDKNSPYLPKNELFINEDLTENDINVRQINFS